MKINNVTNHKLSQSRILQLEKFQKKLAIHFNDIYLLDHAFHHRSYSNEVLNYSGNNERLEFLGDAVLGMSCATYLYQTMENHPEGDLAKIKSVVVSEATLANIALKIGIDTCISLGKGEEKANRHHKDYKTLLQEAYQKKHKVCPYYEVVKKTGPDHDRRFWVSVHLKNITYGPKEGKSKKEAEQEVAKFVWNQLDFT